MNSFWPYEHEESKDDDDDDVDDLNHHRKHYMSSPKQWHPLVCFWIQSELHFQNPSWVLLGCVKHFFLNTFLNFKITQVTVQIDYFILYSYIFWILFSTKEKDIIILIIRNIHNDFSWIPPFLEIDTSKIASKTIILGTIIVFKMTLWIMICFSLD